MKKEERDDADDNCFHMMLLEAVAKKHVKGAREEEENHYSDENRIAHKWTLWLRVHCVIRCRRRWLISLDGEANCCGCLVKIGRLP